MPLQRRVPKFGFKNPNRVVFSGINLDTIEKLAEDNKVNEISPEFLREKSLAGKKDLIKILGRGELNSKLSVVAHAFSKSAIVAIEAKGGSATIVE